MDNLSQPVRSSLRLFGLTYNIHLCDWWFHLYCHIIYISYFVVSSTSSTSAISLYHLHHLHQLFRCIIYIIYISYFVVSSTSSTSAISLYHLHHLHQLFRCIFLHWQSLSLWCCFVLLSEEIQFLLDIAKKGKPYAMSKFFHTRFTCLSLEMSI